MQGKKISSLSFPQLPPSQKWHGSNLLIFAFLRKPGIKLLVALFKKKKL